MSLAQLFESGEQSSQKGHFRNLVLLARIDGTIANEEQGLLNKIANRLSLTEEQVKEICEFPDQYPMVPPSNREERYERFIQLLQMVCVDGKVEATEERLAKKFAYSLGFTEESLNANYSKIISLIGAGHKRDEILEKVL